MTSNDSSQGGFTWSFQLLKTSPRQSMYHKELIPILEDDCTRCHTKDEMIQLQIDREEVLKELRDIYRKLSNHRNFDSIIPEIGLQIVLGTKDMKNKTDIAGFPGRIKRIKGGNPLADIPTFGSSDRSSFLLLRLKEHFPKIRSLAGIKTSEWLIDNLTERDIDYIIIDEFDKEHLSKIDLLPELNLNLPLVIVDTGSIGFEAMTILSLTSVGDNVIILSPCLIIRPSCVALS